MLKVTVDSTHVDTRRGVSSKTGKPWEMHTQSAWVYLVDASGVADRFPTKARFSVDDPAKPYAPGEYLVSPASFRINNWGDLEVAFPKLVAARKPVQAAA